MPQTVTAMLLRSLLLSHASATARTWKYLHTRKYLHTHLCKTGGSSFALDIIGAGSKNRIGKGPLRSVSPVARA